MDLECIVKHTKDSQETISCEDDREFNKQTLYMNTTTNKFSGKECVLVESTPTTGDIIQPVPTIVDVVEPVPTIVDVLEPISTTVAEPEPISTTVAEPEPTPTLPSEEFASLPPMDISEPLPPVDTLQPLPPLSPMSTDPSKYFRWPIHLLYKLLNAYKLLNPNDPYALYKLYNVFKVSNPQLAHLFWQLFPAGLIKWYQQKKNFYGPLGSLIYNGYNAHVLFNANLLNKYFGNEFPGYIDIIRDHYEYRICSQLQYYLMKPKNQLSPAARQWLRQYFEPGNQQPEWMPHVIQQCLKNNKLKKYQWWSLFKLYPNAFSAQSNNNNFVKLLAQEYNSLGKNSDTLNSYYSNLQSKKLTHYTPHTVYNIYRTYNQVPSTISRKV